MRALLSANFLADILAFALVSAGIGIFLELRATNQASLLAVATSVIAGILLALVLNYIFRQLPFTKGAIIGLAWLSLFIIQEFSNILEGAFFTTLLATPTLFLAAVLLGLLVTFIEALLVGFLFTARRPRKSYAREVRKYFGQRSLESWALRVAAASLLYFPIYFGFGALISPIVIPYYTNSSFGLRIPSFEIMVPLEFARGFLYVLALLPIIAVLRTDRRYVYAAMVSLLYVAGALVPFLTSSTLPFTLRLTHGLEILGDCAVYGAVLVKLFGGKNQRFT